jgi:hypothetical protein
VSHPAIERLRAALDGAPYTPAVRVLAEALIEMDARLAEVEADRERTARAWEAWARGPKRSRP